MPVYEYECEACGVFDELRPMAERDVPVPCPLCERTCPRVISAPNLALMSPTIRKAHAVNEQSQHAPRVRSAHTCGSGCGCGNRKVDVVGTAKKSNGAFGEFKTARKTARPWMLGH